MKVDLTGVNEEAFGTSNAPELSDKSSPEDIAAWADRVSAAWVAHEEEHGEKTIQTPRKPTPIRDKLFQLAVNIGPVRNSGMLIHEWLCYKLLGHAYEVVDVFEYAQGCTDITEVCIRCGHPSHR